MLSRPVQKAPLVLVASAWLLGDCQEVTGERLKAPCVAGSRGAVATIIAVPQQYPLSARNTSGPQVVASGGTCRGGQQERRSHDADVRDASLSTLSVDAGCGDTR